MSNMYIYLGITHTKVASSTSMGSSWWECFPASGKLSSLCSSYTSLASIKAV